VKTLIKFEKPFCVVSVSFYHFFELLEAIFGDFMLKLCSEIKQNQRMLVVSIQSRFDASCFDTHLGRFVTKMRSIWYTPSRFDTNSCVCIKLKQKSQIQNQRFHNRIIYPQQEVCVMKWQKLVCKIAKSNLHNMNQSCLLRLSSCFDHHFLLQKCFDWPSFLDSASWRVTSVR